MNDDGRSPPSALRGRLADVYVPALVSGATDALSRRLGNRATVDDPLYGRASSLVSIDPLLARVSSWFAEVGATYTHVASTTGVDRDAAEGRLAITLEGVARELPIAVVAERRRLREIELRIYYAPGGGAGTKPRSPIVAAVPNGTTASLVMTVIDALRSGAASDALGAFEEASHVVDPLGTRHTKRDGKLAAFLGELGRCDLELGGSADDGRTCCLEATVSRKGRLPGPALLSFERGDSGLVRELRVYWE